MRRGRSWLQGYQRCCQVSCRVTTVAREAGLSVLEPSAVEPCYQGAMEALEGNRAAELAGMKNLESRFLPDWTSVLSRSRPRAPSPPLTNSGARDARTVTVFLGHLRR